MSNSAICHWKCDVSSKNSTRGIFCVLNMLNLAGNQNQQVQVSAWLQNFCEEPKITPVRLNVHLKV